MAGPMPGPVRRTGGMSSVNHSVEIAEAPFWTTVNSTKPSGTTTITTQIAMSTVARLLRTVRPERFGLRSGCAPRATSVVVMRPGSS